MTRYSESRGMLYSAPPGPEDEQLDENSVTETTTSDPTPADD